MSGTADPSQVTEMSAYSSASVQQLIFPEMRRITNFLPRPSPPKRSTDPGNPANITGDIFLFCVLRKTKSSFILALRRQARRLL